MLLIELQLSSKVQFQLGKDLVHLAWGLCGVFSATCIFVVLFCSLRFVQEKYCLVLEMPTLRKIHPYFVVVDFFTPEKL